MAQLFLETFKGPRKSYSLIKFKLNFFNFFKKIHDFRIRLDCSKFYRSIRKPTTTPKTVLFCLLFAKSTHQEIKTLQPISPPGLSRNFLLSLLTACFRWWGIWWRLTQAILGPHNNWTLFIFIFVKEIFENILLNNLNNLNYK